MQAIFAASSAVALSSCGGAMLDGDDDSAADPDAQTPGEAGAPVWQPVPTLFFVEGVAGSISIAAFVSDPDGDPLTITKNDMALPPGVTYDEAGQRFVYDGTPGTSSTSGHVLSATDT